MTLPRPLSQALSLAAIGSCLWGCPGPQVRQPGLKPGELLFWRLSSAQTRFTGCGDDPALIPELEKGRLFADGDDLVFQVDSPAEKALWLRCETDAASSCIRQSTDPAFDISGTELRYVRERRAAVKDGGGCVLVATDSWLLVDRGSRLELEVSREHRLVEAPAACLRVDLDFRAASPNGLGLDGCVVTTTAQGLID